MGLVQVVPERPTPASAKQNKFYDALASAFRTGAHTCCLSMSMSSQTRHVCYLKQVRWQPELPLQFLRMRRALLRIRNTSKKMAWMLRRNNGQRLHTMDWLAHRAIGQDYMAASATSVSPQRVRFVYRHYRAGEPDIVATMELLPHQTEVDVVRYNAYLGLVCDIQSQHAALPPEWQQHPSMSFTRWRKRLVRIVVCRHHLEMQCLRWWSLPSLHELLQCNGRLRKNVLRPCFVPTLRLMLDYLATHHNTHDVVFTSPDNDKQ